MHGRRCGKFALVNSNRLQRISASRSKWEVYGVYELSSRWISRIEMTAVFERAQSVNRLERVTDYQTLTADICRVALARVCLCRPTRANTIRHDPTVSTVKVTRGRTSNKRPNVNLLLLVFAITKLCIFHWKIITH